MFHISHKIEFFIGSFHEQDHIFFITHFVVDIFGLVMQIKVLLGALQKADLVDA